MILILEQDSAALGTALEKACALRGMNSLRLTAARLAREIGIELYVSTKGCDGALVVGKRELPFSELAGVYCDLNSFSSHLWPDFSPEDAEYAAQEAHAVWLALLSSLPCRPVNPPAPESLGGAVYSPAELFMAAREVSLQVPAIAYLEAAEARALMDAPVAATVCDLGSANQQEQPLEAWSLLPSTATEPQLRVRERLPGPRTIVCVVGTQVFASTAGGAAAATGHVRPETIPPHVLNGVHALHRKLRLELAEYHFVVLQNGDWVLDDQTRTPGPSTLALHSQPLASALLDVMLTTGDGLA